MNFEQKILNALHPTIWKSAPEIVGEIAKDGTLGYDMALGRINPILRNFEADGLVSRRFRPLTEEQLKSRGGRPKSEYTLTQDGLRRKTELPAENFAPGVPPSPQTI